MGQATAEGLQGAKSHDWEMTRMSVALDESEQDERVLRQYPPGQYPPDNVTPDKLSSFDFSKGSIIFINSAYMYSLTENSLY